MDGIYLNKPARKWDEGLPIGNGRIGAMVMGKPNEETIFINEESLWFGPMRNRINPDCKELIPAIRRLLLDGEVEKAAFIAKMSMTGTPKYNNPFQPAGDLRLCFMHHQDKPNDYKRILDLDTAVATVSYNMNGYHYEREHLVSVKYNVLAIRITSNHPDGITVSANISRKPFEEYTGKLNPVTVGNWGENGAGGVHYVTGATMQAYRAGNEIPVKVMGDFVYAENADEVVIYVSTATDYNDLWDRYAEELKKQIEALDTGETSGQQDDRMLYRLIGNYDGEAALRKLTSVILDRLDAARKAGFAEIYREHAEEYQRLYKRFDLNINNSQNPGIATDQMLQSLRDGDTKHAGYLTVLLVKYARYLLISSSYRCELPANLQGIWNGSYEPPWQSQYTININTEMNYWFADKSGLGECNEPLFALLDKLALTGSVVAKKMYGADGFCAHHNTTLWANAAPEGIFDASPFWPMGAAWLCIHMYEHYLYTENLNFLRERAMPVIEKSVRFFEDYLYRDDEGYLLTGPSLSPENTYCTKTGQKGALCMAPTMDSTILRQLFNAYLHGLEILGISDPERKNKVRQMLDALPPIRVSKDGRIMEWYNDVEETEPGHRHISHLYGLHPGNEINRENRELFEAAEKTLEYRLSHGGGHTGWSKAWVTCFYARLGNGGKVYQNVVQMIQKCIQDNLLDIHPPFQIDGNFGLAEAVMESLVQSHAGYVDLLPALPDEWDTGFIKGIRLRGAMSADICWENGTLKECRIYYDNISSGVPKEITIRYRNIRKSFLISAEKPLVIHPDMLV